MASPASDLDVEFRRVVKSFETNAGLTPEERKCFQITTIDDLKSIIFSIERRQAQDKKLVYLDRIKPFVDTMLEFGKIVEVFLNAADILAFVWGPIKLLLTITQGFSNAFNSLLEIYQEIAEQIPLLQSFKSLFTDYDHMRKLLVMIYEDILSFHSMALKYFRQKVWKQLFASNWKGFTSRVDYIKENLRRHKQLIESHASIYQFEVIRALRLREEKRSQEMYEERVRRRKESVFQWLSPPAIEMTHERHDRVRLSNPGSCSWILNESIFQQWSDILYCITPMLWIHGVPGAGKSVLSSFIIEKIREKTRNEPEISLAYFYFAYGDTQRDNFLAMARSLLAQLLAQNEDLVDCYNSAMEKSCAHGYLSSQEKAENLLGIALKSRKTYIILDGIDECCRKERKDICTWFPSIINGLEKSQQDEIRCLFVSQEDGFAKKDLSMLPEFKITRGHNSSDIHAFARSSQARIEAKFGPCLFGQNEISKIVTARAQGIFIFARCVLEELEQYPSKAALQREWSAESFPEEMEGVYDRIYRRLVENTIAHRRNLTQRLLSWLCQAKRPLKWIEIQAAISLDLDQGSINEKDRRVHDDCKGICASFVEVLEDQTVELVHSTTRDFLIKRNIVKPSYAELDLCLLSVAYLTFPEFSLSCRPRETHEALLNGRYAFYEYAVACWAFHLTSGALDAADHDDEHKKLTSDLHETLVAFLAEHHTGDGPGVTVSKVMHDKLRHFKDSDYYELLSEAVVWTRKQSLINQNTGEDGSNLDFPEVTHNIRSALESVMSNNPQPNIRANLELFYGGALFKCPKTFCQHFYKGFSTQDARDQHLARHERPYMCTFEGCYVATFGCVTQKELEDHLLDTHGVSTQIVEFPDVPDPEAKRSRGQTHTNENTFRCTLCPKQFTRRFNLRSHMRTHTDERPFVCTVCGMSFSRQHDRKRHESLHSGERNFVCGGKLEGGGQWGCGRSFARRDLLSAHFKSETGRLCIEPLAGDKQAELHSAVGIEARPSTSLVKLYSATWSSE